MSETVWNSSSTTAAENASRTASKPARVRMTPPGAVRAMTASATATPAVLDERLRGRIGGCRERELLVRREVVEHVRGRRGDGEQDEAARAGARGAVAAASGVASIRTDDRGALVDDGGVAADDAARDLRVDDVGQVAERPLGEVRSAR